MSDRMRRLLVILFILGGAYLVGRILRPLLGLRLPYGLWIYIVTLGIFVVLGRHLDGVLRRREQSKHQVVMPSRATGKEITWKFCINCGNQVPLDSKFCPSCGSSQ